MMTMRSASIGVALIFLTLSNLSAVPGASAAHTAVDTPRTVLFVGDSNALSIATSVRDAPGRRWSVAIATRFGCGVVPYSAVSEGVVLRPIEPLCSHWERDRRAEIEAQPADVALLFAGGWEQYDRWVAAAPVEYTTDRWMRLTTRDYARVLREMRGSARQVGIVLNSCHRVPETGLPIATMYQAGRYAPVINDEARIAATNLALRAAGRSVGFPVRVLDLHSFLCASGYTETLEGVTLRTDGLHFTAEGSRLIWAWMKREIARW